MTQLTLVSRKKLSHMQQLTSKQNSQKLREILINLNRNLESGWQSFFSRRGRGLAIICPHCEEKPPKTVPQHAKWRWLTTHILNHRRSHQIHKIQEKDGSINPEPTGHKNQRIRP